MTKTLEVRKAEALERLMSIDGARRGQLSRQYYTRKNADGKSIRQGPYFVWQRSVKGQKRSVRIPRDQIERVETELERGREVSMILEDLWSILEEATQEQDHTTKKKAQVVCSTRQRETDAAFDLIRRKAQDGNLNIPWIERTLRDASLRDTARLLESFLNDELPQLLGDIELQPTEHFHSYQSRKVCTALGPIQLRRAYYRGKNGGRYPMDELLGLYDQYTPATVQLICWAGAMDSSFELASETLVRFAGLHIPGRQVQRVVNAFGRQAATWMKKRERDEITKPVEILNIQTDMTGIPARPEELQGIKGKEPDGTAKTRQIKLGCVFTQSRNSQGHPERDPSSSTYIAAFRDRVDFASLLWEEAMKRGYATARKTVFIGDGAEWIWNLVNDRFSDAVQIVDFYHACEHLHSLCQILESDDDRAKALFKRWRTRLKNNGLSGILEATARRLASLDSKLRKAAEAEVSYFETHAERMKYRTFRRKGFFIGSGAIEGGCRHIVAQRAKLSGMRWSCNGAENVMAFRCLIKSNLFDAYCSSHRKAA